MMRYEYRVIPAPTKAGKAKGEKTPEGRFAAELQRLLCELGAEGWSYLRTDTLPAQERAGLTSSREVWRTMLIFQRPLPEPEKTATPPSMPAPTVPAPAPLPEQTADEDPL